MKMIETVDLNTNLLYSKNLNKFHRSFHNIDVLGFYVDKSGLIKNIEGCAIFRTDCNTQGKPLSLQDKIKNPFLVSSIYRGSISDNFYNADILTIKSFNNIKSFLKKYSGQNIGIEFLISDIKYLDNTSIGKRIFDMKWIYELCKRYKFQFILSSGANTYIELISLKVFNIVLEKIDIDVKEYWCDLISWLDNKKITLYYDAE